MIPHMLRIEAQQLGEHFLLVEKLGLDITLIGGMDETMHGHKHRLVDETNYSRVTSFLGNHHLCGKNFAKRKW